MLNLLHDLASGSKMGRGENVGEKMGMGKKLTKIDYLALIHFRLCIEVLVWVHARIMRKICCIALSMEYLVYWESQSQCMYYMNQISTYNCK